MEEMKEMVIKVKKDLHNLLAMNGFAMAMAFDVTNVLTVNYSTKTPMSDDTGVSKVVFEKVWIMFHPFFFIIKGLYVTTTCIVLKRIVMHWTFFGLHL
jgi:hypothetical protein